MRGAWIEIQHPALRDNRVVTSLPVRGAWIEMSEACAARLDAFCRSPCGERGLKCLFRLFSGDPIGRSPCWERGLKFLGRLFRGVLACVAPRAGSVD